MKTKYCNRCDSELSVDNFSKNLSRYDGLQPYCSECMKLYRKEHYQANKVDYTNRSRTQQKFLREFVARVKRRFCCSVCGEKRYWVLDFHHEGVVEKDSEVTKLTSFGSIKRLKAEMRKCKILCANCHRDEHFNPNISSQRRGKRSPKP